MATLEQLRAYEAKLVKAASDPTKSVWYDDFRKESRPFAEIQKQLAWVRSEIAAHPDNPAAQAKPRRQLPRARCDL